MDNHFYKTKWLACDTISCKNKTALLYLISGKWDLPLIFISLSQSQSWFALSERILTTCTTIILDQIFIFLLYIFFFRYAHHISFTKRGFNRNILTVEKKKKSYFMFPHFASTWKTAAINLLDVVITMHNISGLVSANDSGVHASCWLMTVNCSDAA